jgi:hypothetical protein
MLILMNQEVIDIADPLTTLQEMGGFNLRGVPTVSQVVTHGQDAAFAAQGLENAHENVRMTLACLIALSGPANCGIFLYQPGMTSPRQVPVRLGEAPMDTLVYLLSAQQQGGLTAALVNRHVWAAAASVPAA